MLRRVSTVLAIALTVAASTTVFAQGPGADTYKAKCQMCHGADGKGDTPAGKSMKAIPFSDPQIAHKSDAELIASTTNGKGKMPSYKGKLTDDQIKQVVAYVRTLAK